MSEFKNGWLYQNTETGAIGLWDEQVNKMYFIGIPGYKNYRAYYPPSKINHPALYRRSFNELFSITELIGSLGE